MLNCPASTVCIYRALNYMQSDRFYSSIISHFNVIQWFLISRMPSASTVNTSFYVTLISQTVVKVILRALFYFVCKFSNFAFIKRLFTNVVPMYTKKWSHLLNGVQVSIFKHGLEGLVVLKRLCPQGFME